MKRITFTYIYILMALVMPVTTMSGQDGHTHSHDEEGMEHAHLTTGVFSVYAETQKYELTLKHGRIEPGEESDLQLYIADYMTNRPVDQAQLKVTVQEDPSIIVETEVHDTGVYHLHVNFPKEQPYSLAVNIQSEALGPDLLLLSHVEVGKDPVTADGEEAGHDDHEHSDWWKYALVFVGGLAAGYFILRRRPKAIAAFLIVVGMHVVLQQAHAHGGHGEEKETTAGNEVMIPKETQFLFDITTQMLKPGSFHPSVELFGTIIPAPGEYASIMSPQSGRITSLAVVPGQKVNAGQTLAVIQASTTLSEQIGVATETGRLRADIQTAQAELNAAEAELSRLKSIEDIAAKKDVQAAHARVNAARANLQSLRSITSGTVTGTSGTISLKAPVSGVVGQFTLSKGSEVMGGTPLFTVTSLDKVYIEAQVYDRDASVVRGASSYHIASTNGDRNSDQVSLVSSALEVNPSNQSQKFIFELRNPNADFKVGEFVTVRAFQQKSDKVIFIPNRALSEINGKPVVFVKENPELYAVRFVSLGEDSGSNTVVEKGLGEGDRFVIGGTYQVKMMMLNQ